MYDAELPLFINEAFDADAVTPAQDILDTQRVHPAAR